MARVPTVPDLEDFAAPLCTATEEIHLIRAIHSGDGRIIIHNAKACSPENMAKTIVDQAEMGVVRYTQVVRCNGAAPDPRVFESQGTYWSPNSLINQLITNLERLKKPGQDLGVIEAHTTLRPVNGGLMMDEYGDLWNAHSSCSIVKRCVNAKTEMPPGLSVCQADDQRVLVAYMKAWTEIRVAVRHLVGNKLDDLDWADIYELGSFLQLLRLRPEQRQSLTDARRTIGTADGSFGVEFNEPGGDYGDIPEASIELKLHLWCCEIMTDVEKDFLLAFQAMAMVTTGGVGTASGQGSRAHTIDFGKHEALLNLAAGLRSFGDNYFFLWSAAVAVKKVRALFDDTDRRTQVLKLSKLLNDYLSYHDDGTCDEETQLDADMRSAICLKSTSMVTFDGFAKMHDYEVSPYGDEAFDHQHRGVLASHKLNGPMRVDGIRVTTGAGISLANVCRPTVSVSRPGTRISVIVKDGRFMSKSRKIKDLILRGIRAIKSFSVSVGPVEVSLELQDWERSAEGGWNNLGNAFFNSAINGAMGGKVGMWVLAHVLLGDVHVTQSSLRFGMFKDAETSESGGYKAMVPVGPEILERLHTYCIDEAASHRVVGVDLFNNGKFRRLTVDRGLMLNIGDEEYGPANLAECSLVGNYFLGENDPAAALL